MVSKLHAKQETGKNTCEYIYNTHIKYIKKHHLKYMNKFFKYKGKGGKHKMWCLQTRTHSK